MAKKMDNEMQTTISSLGRRATTVENQAEKTM